MQKGKFLICLANPRHPSIFDHKKKPFRIPKGLNCRGGGIRTPGTSRYNGFQDRRDRPLCHSSKAFSIGHRVCKNRGFP
jgi:hypothetical protein